MVKQNIYPHYGHVDCFIDPKIKYTKGANNELYVDGINHQIYFDGFDQTILEEVSKILE